jgi:hypothetical protein
MIIVKEQKEASVLYLFGQDGYIGLNREQQFEKAISEGWIYNILRGRWRKEIKY